MRTRQVRSPTTGADAPAVRRAGDAALRITLGYGTGVASTVYGTVLVMATITAAYANERDPAKLAEIVIATALVLWVAHLHAHSIAESIALGRRVGRADIRRIAVREIGIVGAAALPCCALILGAVDVVPEPTAVWGAFAIGLVTLGAEGIRYARMERLGAAATAGAVALNLALGVGVVALKVAIYH
jgi:hypothetical protein